MSPVTPEMPVTLSMTLNQAQILLNAVVSSKKLTWEEAEPMKLLIQQQVGQQIAAAQTAGEASDAPAEDKEADALETTGDGSSQEKSEDAADEEKEAA